MKCPNCGTGPIFRAYLKPRDHCAVCGEDFTPQRADDGPAYVTILITGHIIAPLMFYVYFTFRPEPIVMALGFCAGFTAIALFMLPRIKGAFIALQWAKRMHGFADTDSADNGDMVQT